MSIAHPTVLHATTPRIFRIAAQDDVAVALEPLTAGEQVHVDGASVILRDDVPAGHKFALRDLTQGAPVLRYRARIGLATRAIATGEHVHSHNLATALAGEADYSFTAAAAAAPVQVSARTFRGFVRPDGSVGTRNELWILPTVGCVGRLGERLAQRGNAMIAAMPQAQGRIDGVHAFNHPFGCSQLGADLDGTAAVIASLALNPNAGGVLLLGLGCESNQLDALLTRIPESHRARLQVLRAQSESDEFAAGEALMAQLLADMTQDQRTDVPLSALRLGVKCGGSDALSGLTANPLIGRMADAVTGAGGAAILTEIPEIFGAETLLMQRATSKDVFDKLTALVNSFKRYFLDHGEPVSENPSPGNIAGGITTLEEKSLGAVQKGGLAPVADVISYGQRISEAGLTVLEAPGNDAVSTTALAAAGATITLFSTGRGTPLGSPVPTMKIASNSALATRKPGWIDFDAGAALSAGMDETADALLDRIVEIASGAPTCNERNDERAIGIWKRGVTL
ncbi:altronate dehydratase family protein [Novosphingobium sp. SL115]|uniref:UxaA family hydrolase n=1 Tax=Novosphingobium sp. SL115 TaxID=2995150 RepID=UPI00227492A4|nr:altronate dehydratase family protein [Novosphingobium sp. SL115]MCY1673020.1 altronate dehydratase family protein [Novosphingobium sp. SL115]